MDSRYPKRFAIHQQYTEQEVNKILDLGQLFGDHLIHVEGHKLSKVMCCHRAQRKQPSGTQPVM